MDNKLFDVDAGYLCMLDEVPDGGALGLAGESSELPGIVLVRRGDEVWAYRNVCPHFSIPLNYQPETFWTYDAAVLMCAHHSAMFRFEDGLCVDGPCQGASLMRIPVCVKGRQIFNGTDERSDSQSSGN